MERRQLQPEYTAYGDAPLCIAIREGYTETAFHFARHAFGLNVADRNRDFPLHLAVRESNQELVGVLLSSGASPNVIDSMGMTPLHIAALRKSPELVSLLLQNGANPENLPECEKLSVTSPLRLAVSGHNEGIVEFLLKAGANPHKRDVFGQTDFIRALSLDKEGGRMCSLMVQQSKDLDQRCSRGLSSLSWAIHQNSCAMAHAILEQMSFFKIDYQPDYHPILIAIKKNCWICFNNIIGFRGVQELRTSGENLPSALEMALVHTSWKMDIIDGSQGKVFHKHYNMANDSRYGFAKVLISKYGVDVGNSFFQSILSDCAALRNGIVDSRMVLSLCISAYGGFFELGNNDKEKHDKVSALFETLGKNQTYNLLSKLYEAGFCCNTGNVLAIRQHHERNNLPPDICSVLQQFMKEARTLKNLAVLRVRSCLQSNVIYQSQSLGVPTVMQNIITLRHNELP